MKRYLLMGLGLSLGATGSYAGQEVGNGGDTCLKSIPIITTAVLESLNAQGQSTYTEFDFATLRFFVKRTTIDVVPKTIDENGNETDATSLPSQKKVHLSRARWCGQPDEDKASLLFHEFLVVMEIEKTGVYDVSSRFVYINRSQEQERLKERWVCTVPVHTCINETCYDSDFTSSLRVGKGPTPTDALENARKIYSWGYTPCYRVQNNPNRENKFKYDYYCSESVTVANSCVDTMR